MSYRTLPSQIEREPSTFLRGARAMYPALLTYGGRQEIVHNGRAIAQVISIRTPMPLLLMVSAHGEWALFTDADKQTGFCQVRYDLLFASFLDVLFSKGMSSD